MERKRTTAKQLAGEMDVDRETMRKLLLGVLPIDREKAALLSKCLGGSDQFWLAREKQYREQLELLAADIDRVEAAAWLKSLPLKQMMEEGWIKSGSNTEENVRAAMGFFNVSGPAEWQSQYSHLTQAYAFRTSPTFESKIGALAAWLRRGEAEARLVSCAPFDAEGFKAIMPELRKLTRSKSPENFIPKLQAMCALHGVAVVFVRPPVGCRASGASRKLDADKAMIVLSFRYLSDDHFWFTLFHEAGHLILHPAQDTFVDGEEFDSDPREDEANEFSSNILIPNDYMGALMELPARSNTIIRFALSIGTSPGVVVGQMQHRKRLTSQQMNGLKRRYSWDRIAEVLATQ